MDELINNEKWPFTISADNKDPALGVAITAADTFSREGQLRANAPGITKRNGHFCSARLEILRKWQ